MFLTHKEVEQVESIRNNIELMGALNRCVDSYYYHLNSFRIVCEHFGISEDDGIKFMQGYSTKEILDKIRVGMSNEGFSKDVIDYDIQDIYEFYSICRNLTMLLSNRAYAYVLVIDLGLYGCENLKKGKCY